MVKVNHALSNSALTEKIGLYVADTSIKIKHQYLTAITKSTMANWFVNSLKLKDSLFTANLEACIVEKTSQIVAALQTS